MECPFSLEINDKEDQDDPMEDADEHLMKQEETDKLEPVEDFQVYQPPDPKSVFDAEIIAKKKEEERLAHIKGSVIDDDEPDFEKDDPFGRSRKHAWVFINKAKREIADAFFVEPSTGRKYQVEDAPYFSIESIFNHKNYWINMDPSRGIDEINLEFDNDTTGEWEYVMINNDDKKGEDEEENEEDEDDDDGEGGGGDDEVLDMPPPWSPKLYVVKEKFAELCPKGEKTVFYKKCKVEFFSDCSVVDGLVKRITIYEDYKRIIVKEVRS